MIATVTAVREVYEAKDDTFRLAMEEEISQLRQIKNLNNGQKGNEDIDQVSMDGTLWVTQVTGKERQGRSIDKERTEVAAM